MIDKIYLVTDLGPGDGGKGGVVHKLANTFNASIVLKFGGGQGSHGVVTDAGEEFAFSHWGGGTLEGVPTMITPRFTVIPHAILNEGTELQRLGFNDPYALLSIDPRALCATPFHQVASQLHELSRKDSPRGTVGTGAGEAYRMKQRFGDSLSLKMSELNNPGVIREKLISTIDYYRKEFEELVIERDFLADDYEIAEHLMSLLIDPEYVDWTLNEYSELMKTSLTLVNLERVLKNYSGVAIAECSHGVLTDSVCGFIPHVSAIRTLPKFAIETLKQAGCSGRIVRLGVTRAYAIRHGAGPLPTANDALCRRLLPHSHKDTNRWQGEVRVGALDFNLLRYAINACGGSTHFDGLCVTCLDQVVADNVWKFCDHYYIDSARKCLVCGEFPKCVDARILSPKITTINCKDLTQQELIDKCCKMFYQQLEVPVRLISLGPSDQDKILL